MQVARLEKDARFWRRSVVESALFTRTIKGQNKPVTFEVNL